MSLEFFLELLAREAPAVEFEAPVLEARAAGASPETLERLEHGKRIALQIRATLERRARREAELAALFETASDLAGLRDLDAVLEAIVRRARRLLHADVSYMTLNDDERGDTYMRVTDGSVSAAFRALRLPLGAGLGGLVAQTGMPYTSGSYLSDDQFRHTTEIDTAVAEEGLVSILGVPMRLGSRSIGVLFAAHRTDHPFAKEEVALLSSLAAYAAVAIDNARLLAETRAALEELSAANEVIRARGDAVERAAQAHDRMADLVVRGAGVADICRVVVDVLGGTVFVLEGDAVLASVGGEPDPADLAIAADLAAASRTTGRTVSRGALRVATATAGAETLCTLVLRCAGEPSDTLSDIDQRILERAAIVIALLRLIQRSVAEAEGRVRGDLLRDLLDGRMIDRQTMADRARRVGVEPGDRHVLVVVRHDADDETGRRRAAFWAASHATAHHGLFQVQGAEIILLLPGEDPGETARGVARELGQSLGAPATAGAAGPVTALEPLTACYEEAKRCADALLALGRRGTGAGARELGFVGLLIGHDNDVTGFVESALGPVLDYDAKRGTELVATLDAYFGCGGALSKTAARLHIHTNTVTQRLERVGRLLGPGWQEPERALELQLALRLHRLRLE
ncbi:MULTISPECIES: helix-turn-helix domain-containing protein [Thermomonospora]|uniref:Sugar diacid utilization regulator n=1 Tax=Thermomonospora cellulosilytica TaxID=1411118 RepID=A0A7W3MVH9_9ACTN|nr:MULTISPECIES: helix-turn-helix domain-containing protein [Thermomonospora]MBA9002660.1 sugar diacid utilization regulator [Thermomonospora cellulosilytica]